MNYSELIQEPKFVMSIDSRGSILGIIKLMKDSVERGDIVLAEATVAPLPFDIILKPGIYINDVVNELTKLLGADIDVSEPEELPDGVVVYEAAIMVSDDTRSISIDPNQSLTEIEKIHEYVIGEIDLTLEYKFIPIGHGANPHPHVTEFLKTHNFEWDVNQRVEPIRNVIYNATSYVDDMNYGFGANVEFMHMNDYNTIDDAANVSESVVKSMQSNENENVTINPNATKFGVYAIDPWFVTKYTQMNPQQAVLANILRKVVINYVPWNLTPDGDPRINYDMVLINQKTMDAIIDALHATESLFDDFVAGVFFNAKIVPIPQDTKNAMEEK